MKKNLNFFFTFLICLLILSNFIFAQNDGYLKDKTDYSKSNKLANELIQKLEKNDIDSLGKYFDAYMQANVTNTTISKMWNSMKENRGKFNGIIDIKNETLGPKQISELVAIFGKSKLIVRIIFDAEYKISGFYIKNYNEADYEIVPPYTNYSKFEDLDVEFGTDEYQLRANLTIPKNVEKCPVVILVHGSGPNDKDVSIGPNKIFKNIAYGLVNQGVAVLRYNKRTFQYATKLSKNISSLTCKEEVTDDVLEAIKYLKSYQDVQFTDIFVLGHSLGACLVPRINQLDTSISGFIMCAGSPRKLEDLYIEQIEYISKIDTAIRTEYEKILEHDRPLANLLKNKSELEKSNDVQLMGLPKSYWIYLNEYDVIEEAKKIKKPTLILQGERDYQVRMKDFEIFKSELKSNNFTFKSYPKLNHLMLEGEGISNPQEYQQSNFVSLDLINDIALWINNNSKKEK